MMAILNLKTAWDKCPPPIRDLDKADLKVGDMVLIKNHTPEDTFDSKYNPCFQNCKRILDKALDVHNITGKVR